MNLLAAGSAVFGGKTKFYINLKHDLIKFVPAERTVYGQAEYSLAKVAGGIEGLADGIGGINAENAGRRFQRESLLFDVK